MHGTLEKLLAAGPVATDGAWATQLQERGLAVGECPDAWNLKQPELVEQVARAYVEAGSRVILTNTFGANRFVLARHHLAEQAAAINDRGRGHLPPRRGRPRAGLRLPRAQRADAPDGRDERIGCPGGLRPTGRGLRQAGADGIVVETMSDPAEAALAVAAAHGTGLPVVVSMTFGAGAKKDRTLMGTTPEQAAEQLLAAGADLVGGQLRPGDRRLRGYLLPPARRRRAARLDQGQRRPARVARREGGIPPDGRGVCCPCSRPGGRGGGPDRRLLRHHAGVHRRCGAAAGGI